jgi:hypothetical protein
MGGRDIVARKAMITNPGQLRKNVVRAMRKLLDKKLIDVRPRRPLRLRVRTCTHVIPRGQGACRAAKDVCVWCRRPQRLV